MVQKRFVTAMLLILSVGFSKEMPKGSPQYVIAQEVLGAVGAYEIDCPSSFDKRVEAVCGVTQLEPDTVRPLVDLTMFDYDATEAWQFSDLYRREFRFGDGLMAVTVIPEEPRTRYGLDYNLLVQFYP